MNRNPPRLIRVGEPFGRELKRLQNNQGGSSKTKSSVFGACPNLVDLEGGRAALYQSSICFNPECPVVKSDSFRAKNTIHLSKWGNICPVVKPAPLKNQQGGKIASANGGNQTLRLEGSDVLTADRQGPRQSSLQPAKLRAVLQEAHRFLQGKNLQRPPPPRRPVFECLKKGAVSPTPSF